MYRAQERYNIKNKNARAEWVREKAGEARRSITGRRKRRRKTVLRTSHL
jgi:hypothetical protein